MNKCFCSSQSQYVTQSLYVSSAISSDLSDLVNGYVSNIAHLYNSTLMQPPSAADKSNSSPTARQHPGKSDIGISEVARFRR